MSSGKEWGFVGVKSIIHDIYIYILLLGVSNIWSLNRADTFGAMKQAFLMLTNGLLVH